MEVRWSARRVGEGIAVDAGVFVRFVKSNMFASKIKSGTVAETAPIHLDLFEVVKAAIASGEEGGQIGEIEEEVLEEEVEVKQPEGAEVSASDTLSKMQGVFRGAVAALLSLSPTQKLLLGSVASYLIAKMLSRGAHEPDTEAIRQLTQKVDDLKAEVGEMRALLERILEQSNQGEEGRVVT